MEERIGPVRETKGFEQLGILVLDGSGSMQSLGETGQAKADEVNHAVRDLISRMKTSRRRDNFLLALITYDHRVTVRLEPEPVVGMDETTDYNPLNGHGGETAIGDALSSASAMAEAFLAEQGSFARSVVIVLMTDGQNNSGANPVEVATSIKASGKRITICAAGYGKEEVDALTLQSLVSEPNGYIRAYDPDQLRKFFEASISKAQG